MLKPLGDRVLVKPLPAEEVTKSGIVIPDSAKERPAEGEIVALGNGKTKDGEYKFSVKVGDKVLYSKYAGDEIRLPDPKNAFGGTIEYKVMKEDEILGIF